MALLTGDRALKRKIHLIFPFRKGSSRGKAGKQSLKRKNNLVFPFRADLITIFDMMKFSEFILKHENDDPADLVLHRDRWPDIDVALAAECISARRKLRDKVPEWYANPCVICPSALSAEQCSSSATARYKSAVAERIAGVSREDSIGFEAGAEGSQRDAGRPGRGTGRRAIRRIVDLTGGLGVDTWQFSKAAEAVLYNEMNPVLFEAAKTNLNLLGCDNVEFSNIRISPDTLPGLLEAFKPDLVFADPARRSEGRKVFLPEDCAPDMLALQDIILDRGCSLMVKLSPMADISLMLSKFHCVREIHIVEVDGEGKELLLLMAPASEGKQPGSEGKQSGSEGRDQEREPGDQERESGSEGKPLGQETVITVLNRESPCPERHDNLRFFRSEESAATPTYISGPPVPGQLLFEPGPALAKSGFFNLLSARFGLRKFGPSAHLYCMDAPSPDSGPCMPGSSGIEQLAGYGKWFEIQDVAPFGKQALRDFAARWPETSVTARALPLSSDGLRLKLSALKGKAPRTGDTFQPGNGKSLRSDNTPQPNRGETHLFGIGSAIGRLLILAERVN